MRPTLVGERHMVSAGHPLVADVATRVFEQGGNAVDAGVAAGLAANVVQADMCNFGGVAPLLVRAAGSDQVWSIAGLGGWGEDVTLAAHLERFGGDMPAGAGCAVVPGAPAAWIAALRRFGTWDFTSAVAPAIELASEGFAVDRRTAESLGTLGRKFAQWETSRSIYWPRGRAPTVGERLVQSDLAALLGALAAAEHEALDRGGSREEGLTAAHRAFYEGETAERIAAFVRGGGGWMSLDDLRGFEAEIEPAVSSDYGGWSISVNDTWTQGPALLQVLAILSGFKLSGLEHNGTRYVHLLAEAIKLAFSDRERFYADPRHVDVPLQWLLSDERATELRGMIDPRSALPNLPTLGAAGQPSAGVRERHLDTTYLCTADARGNAFSATMSDTLDGGPLVPGLGIIVSPRGVQSRLDPDHAAVLAAGKRPRLTPAPALALRSGDGDRDAFVWPFGCPGGDMILQGMVQAFLNVVEFGMTAQQAVESPRVGCYSYPDSFFPHVEVSGCVSVEGGFSETVKSELAAIGHRIVDWPRLEFDAGGVSMVLELEGSEPGHRVLAAADDPRRTCYAGGR